MQYLPRPERSPTLDTLSALAGDPATFQQRLSQLTAADLPAAWALAMHLAERGDLAAGESSEYLGAWCTAQYLRRYTLAQRS